MEKYKENEESILMKIYELYRNELKQSDEYRDLLKKLNKMVEEKKDINEILELNSLLCAIENKEYFKKGYSLGVKLIVEGINYKG